MTYTEALEYIHFVEWRGSRPGLSRISELCGLMGDPQDSLRFVHVGGTNGKGSVCTMLSSVLTEAGYKTGLFTSPYVKEFNERIRVNGKNIGNDELAEVTEFVRSFAETMEDKPTEFELITAIAFEHFKRTGCDIVILEVGLGGRLDSTNIIKTPVLSVITEISLDHTAVLGDTVEAIAKEKAGIIKSGVPVVFAGTDPIAERVIREAAEKSVSPYSRPEYATLRVASTSVGGSFFNFGGKQGYKIILAGLYQPRNAAAVIHTVDVLRKEGFTIKEDALRHGLSRATWPARFETLRRLPTVIYDGGHNPGGVKVAFDSVHAYFPDKKITVLTGIMADKEYKDTVKISAPYIARAFTVTPAVPRALSAVQYAEEYQALGIDALACESIDRGVAMAIADSCNEERPLFIFGSLYMYADILAAIDRILPQARGQS